jgi:cytidylate kinase
MAGPVIAIDGTAGSGKSTLARCLARAIGFRYIDSGAMYRALGWLAGQKGIDLSNEAAVAELAGSVEIRVQEIGGENHTFIDGSDVTEDIRTPAAAEASSRVAVHPGARSAMVNMQRQMAEAGGIVMEGRDIGTVVFPDAKIKFFLDAELRVRAQRRAKEQLEKGIWQPVEAVTDELLRRDKRDSGRADGPLKQAEDAVLIDTTDRTLADLERQLLQTVKTRLAETA